MTEIVVKIGTWFLDAYTDFNNREYSISLQYSDINSVKPFKVSENTSY